jgi:hypothetical protein
MSRYPPPDVYTAAATLAHRLRLVEVPEGSGEFRSEVCGWSMLMRDLGGSSRSIVFGSDELAREGGGIH